MKNYYQNKKSLMKKENTFYTLVNLCDAKVKTAIVSDHLCTQLLQYVLWAEAHEYLISQKYVVGKERNYKSFGQLWVFFDSIPKLASSDFLKTSLNVEH
jgi:hypothetical protein